MGKATDAGALRSRTSALDPDAAPPSYDQEPYIAAPEIQSTRSINSDAPPSYHDTKRSLKARHIQLIGLGGAIGTALFVQMGAAMTKGGPGSLFIAFVIWCFPVLAVANNAAEFVTYLPVSSPFIRMGGRTFGSAFECMAGWNFYILEATLIPFEITAVNVIIHFWRDDYNPGITIAVQVSLVLDLQGVIHFPMTNVCSPFPTHNNRARPH